MGGYLDRRRAPIRLRDRKIGDDWKFHATTTDDVSGWGDADVHVEVRTGEAPTAELVASTADGSVTLDGDPLRDVPASDFNAGELWVLVRREATVDCPPGRVWMEVSVTGDPSLRGRETVGTFWFNAVAQVAVEP